MPVTSVQALQLSQLLGALMASVVDAQAQAARATVEFVEDIGFEETPEGDHLRNVKLRYFKKDENGQQAKFEVQVPLLALVNVPALAVRQAKLTFSYDVVTATATSTASSAGGASTVGLKLPVAKITGFIRRPPATTPETERRTTAIDLEVTLEQQDMPIGIERLFDLAELGISERPADGGTGNG
jgi:Protein of unknown function (DUF2589)